MYNLHDDQTPAPQKPFAQQIEEDCRAMGLDKIDLDADMRRIGPNRSTGIAGVKLDLLQLNFAANRSPSDVRGTATGPITTPTPSGPSVRISIRIRTPTLEALQREAKRRGVGYQTLANQILALATATW